jgi:hypothetical protein
MCAGVVVFRGAAAALRGGEQLARNGPPLVRLALVGLARAPAGAALAIAFIAVSTGLGGFALAYRATLERSTADQADDQVPLDAIVTPGADFVRPLQLASRSEWTALAHGVVMPVRRTDASYLDNSSTVTVPAIGIAASELPRLRGWRAGEASAPVSTLARRLVVPGPARVAGPQLSSSARFVALRAQSAGVALSLTAELRDPDGGVRSVALGVAGARSQTLRARVPPGSWEVEALELDEPAGLQATNGHQNAENPAGATQSSMTASFGSLRALDAAGRPLLSVRLDRWRGVGAASAVHRRGADAVVLFATSGQPGVLRPTQPSDLRPLAVLADPQTAAAAGNRGQLSLSIGGAPVQARVVGVLARFPTLPADSGGFIVADQQQLAGALDAQTPGQSRPDELWISSSDLGPMRSALARPPLSDLSASFRADIERQLRSAPITHDVLRTLLAATLVAAVLAGLGLVVSLLGSGRDPRLEQELVAQGLGPAGVRQELSIRILLAALLGVAFGLAASAVLARLAVATVRAAGSVAAPRPPLVGIVPWPALVLWSVIAFGLLSALGWGTLYGRRIRA